jgi:FkbM family methyltransferase
VGDQQLSVAWIESAVNRQNHPATASVTCRAVRRALRQSLVVALHVIERLRPYLGLRLANSRLSQLITGTGEVRATRLGRQMTLQLGDNVQRALYLAGTYEPAFLDLLRRELVPGDTYLDIGGHVGIDAIVASDRIGPSGRVYVFEPAPDSVEKLRQIADSNMTIIQAALGSRFEQLELRANSAFDEEDAATRSLVSDGPVVARVSVMPFDDWRRSAGMPHVDVVKIDVEGSEYDVLLGMSETLRESQPRVVVVELEPQWLAHAGRTVEDVEQLLGRAGYTAEETVGHNRVFRPTGQRE